MKTSRFLRPAWYAFACLIISTGLMQSGSCADTSTRELMLKAVETKPSPRQMAWHENEYIAFVHFGVNTFSAREWGTGMEDPRSFNPTNLDTDQWCRAMKALGMKMVILTVKHHDGFCLWPTRYTDHSVASSPWRDGKGDVLRDLTNSCKKFGIKLGIYLSPADLYQIENPKGIYGNLSEYTERTIPRPVPGRPFQDKRTFTFKVDDYNEYFLNQLFELLTEYGPVHEVWFDGAHPKRKGGQTYTHSQWYELIRTLAPKAVIFGKGPDVRWCGNEGGGTRQAEWNVIPISKPVNEFDWPDMTDNDLASLDKIKESLDKGGLLHYYPAETNTSIRNGWFWRDEQQHVKPTKEILDIWYRSVGGNSVFLLNIPPNRDGQFPQRDVKVLEEVGEIIKTTFANNLAEGASASASHTRGNGFEAANALDGNTKTCWMPPDWTEQPELTITLPKAQTFNRVMFQEQIRDYSQRIARYSVDAFVDGEWLTISEGQTVGYKRICRTATTTTDKVRIRILDSRVCPTISNFGLFFEKPLESEVAGPARSSRPDGWKVVSASSEQMPDEGKENAIDGDPATIWHTRWNPETDTYPHEIVIDLGKTETLQGFTYTPRTGQTQNGTIKDYAFHVSLNGKDWGEPVSKGQFANIKNDPTKKYVNFEKPVQTRFLKIIALSEIDGNPWASAAEIGIIGKE